jgi:hypothetical protein
MGGGANTPVTIWEMYAWYARSVLLPSAKSVCAASRKNDGKLSWTCRSTCESLQLSKVKVKVTLEQATKAQRGSRDIALFFL